MTTANPNKVFVLARILETDELFAMLNRGVGSRPLTYCPFLVQSQVLLAPFATTGDICLTRCPLLHQGLFCKTIYQSSACMCQCLGFFLQGWNLAFLFFKFHEVPVRSALQPLKAPLNGSKTIWCIIDYFQLFGICQVSFCSIT